MAQPAKFLLRCAMVAAGALLSLAVLAGNEKITGVFVASGTDGGYLIANFTCFGLPTCTGI